MMSNAAQRLTLAHAAPWRLAAVCLLCLACLLRVGFVRVAGAAPLDDYAQHWAEQSDISGSWSLQRGGVVLAEGSRGSVRGFLGQPIATDTAFWIGSNSKQFAAAAVLRLVEQGRLELGAPLTRYFPELNASAVTRGGTTCSIEHVLSHRCGLVRDGNGPAGLAGHLANPKQEARLFDAVNAEALRFDPGTGFEYSNLGYSLLGLLVQRASGQSHEQYLQEQFWARLGMVHTGIRPRDGIQFARGQAGGVFTWVDAADWLFIDLAVIQELGAAGNMYSTAHDLAVWTHALHHGEVLQPASHAELVRPRAEDYALGLQVTKQAIGKLIHHDGELAPYAYSSQVAYLPEHDLVAVVLANRALTAGHTLPFAGALLRKASGQEEKPPVADAQQARLTHSADVAENALLLPLTIWMLLRRVRRPERLDRQNWWLSYHIYAVLLGGALSAYRSSPLDPFLLCWAVLVLAGAYKSRWWLLPNWQRRPGLRPYLWLGLRASFLLVLLAFSLTHFLQVFAALCVAEAALWLVAASSRGLANSAPAQLGPPVAPP
ncbi:MAG: serine hydrolase domain-containing protein [Deltaproteobacteria bacterium]